ncbi:MAG TPA: ABC transporter ATP-binding protein [Sphingobacteriaceae bacterium]|nr:ABC transporter ATP-binding protein [Sphingobacteriaceae bacterium]
MKIILENIGRRFNREWIFREINYTFESGQSYAVLGLNGSGKSTLLQLLSGSLTPSEGTISYQSGGKDLDIESVFQQLSMAAPYMELIEEFTLQEQIDFHFGFKRYRDGMDVAKVIEILGLEKSRNKAIKYFSSGMKQRTKLALAFCSDTPVLLLDEPVSNLDANGIAWYLDLVQQFASDRLVIICSNQDQEYSFCKHRIQVGDYK